jgi:enoyl-CoA hydratase/carnithine racemase
MNFASANNAMIATVIRPHVALVTINRPAARNAVNSDVALGLERAIQASESASNWHAR